MKYDMKTMQERMRARAGARKRRRTAPGVDRDAVVRDARDLFRVRFPDVYRAPLGKCIAAAYCTLAALMKHGLEGIPQGGTCIWPRLTREQAEADAAAGTHFGYVFEPDAPLTRALLAADVLPEVHAWVAIPATMDIVDITSGDFPEQARLLAGYDWPGVRPPAYLWAKPSSPDWPTSVSYRPDHPGTELVMRAIQRLIRENPRPN